MANRQSFVNEAIGFARALESAALHLSRSVSDDVQRTLFANLYALAATLRDASHLGPPLATLREPLLPALRELSPQCDGDPDAVPFWQWMTLAALAEHEGDMALAELMVTEVLAHVESQLPSDAEREQRAVCWTRRGRLSRERGDLDNAEECYREALRLVRRQHSIDAWSHAQLGLSVVANLRGNLPEMERRLRLVASRKPVVPAVYGVPAHQALSTACRRRGDFIDALLHAWHAYDLLDREDIRRFEILNTLAQVALEAGELDAAERGYQQVVASRGPERVIVPARIGLSRVWAGRLSHTRTGSERMQVRQALREAIGALSTTLATAVQPIERNALVAATGEAFMALGEWARAREQLTLALGTARQHGFNRQAFRAERELARVDVAQSRTAAQAAGAASGDGSAVTVTSIPHGIRPGKPHPAVLRLVQLNTH